MYLCVRVFLWLSCEVFASHGDGCFSVWSIQFMLSDRWVSPVSSINYISIFSPVKQRAETVIHSIIFVMQRRTTVFSIWKKFTISCSVASCQHTKTNSVSIKVDLDQLPVLHCIAVSQLLCCSVAPSKLDRLNNWSY